MSVTVQQQQKQQQQHTNTSEQPLDTRAKKENWMKEPR